MVPGGLFFIVCYLSFTLSLEIVMIKVTAQLKI